MQDITTGTIAILQFGSVTGVAPVLWPQLLLWCKNWQPDQRWRGENGMWKPGLCSEQSRASRLSAQPQREMTLCLPRSSTLKVQALGAVTSVR
jgi:hypothetical protein